MIYNIQNYKIDLDDKLLQDFKKEMGTISQEMIDTCTQIALLRYNDIRTEEYLKKRVEDTLFMEMMKHQSQKETIYIQADKSYQIKNYIISVSKELLDEYECAKGCELSYDGLYGYVHVADLRHVNQHVSNEQMSQFTTEEIMRDIARYFSNKPQACDIIQANRVYQVHGYNITLSQEKINSYKQAIGDCLDQDGLYAFAHMALKKHKNEQYISDHLMSQYIMNEIDAEVVNRV